MLKQNKLIVTTRIQI